MGYLMRGVLTFLFLEKNTKENEPLKVLLKISISLKVPH